MTEWQACKIHTSHMNIHYCWPVDFEFASVVHIFDWKICTFSDGAYFLMVFWRLKSAVKAREQHQRLLQEGDPRRQSSARSSTQQSSRDEGLQHLAHLQTVERVYSNSLLNLHVLVADQCWFGFNPRFRSQETIYNQNLDPAVGLWLTRSRTLTAISLIGHLARSESQTD